MYPDINYDALSAVELDNLKKHTEDKRDLFHACLDHWGVTKQLIATAEELCEASAAILRVVNGKRPTIGETLVELVQARLLIDGILWAQSPAAWGYVSYEKEELSRIWNKLFDDGYVRPPPPDPEKLRQVQEILEAAAEPITCPKCGQPYSSQRSICPICAVAQGTKVTALFAAPSIEDALCPDCGEKKIWTDGAKFYCSACSWEADC